MARTEQRDQSDRAPVVVAFIGATGRSGSTLLARVLDAVPGVCSVGELCWLWNYGLQLNRPCGCGRPLLECDFWDAVGRLAFGGWANVDVERAVQLRRRLSATRSLPSTWSGRGSRARDLDEYRALMAPLYRAIAEVSGASTVVDNSKQPGVALVNRRVEGVELRLVHLVRRSEGVAYSWSKQVARPDLSGGQMRRRGISRTAGKWLLDNALFEAVGRSGTRRRLLRYEDLVAAPREQTLDLLDFLDARPQGGLEFLGEHDAELGTDHSVWGNPMRLTTGRVAISADEGWRTGLGGRRRAWVRAITWPGLVRYRYLSWRRAGS